MIQNNGRYFVFNPGEKEMVYEIKLPGEAENAVFNHSGKICCLYSKNDLFVTFSNGKTVQVTSDGGNGIVNGKTVHRSEFGITNGIFNSPDGNFIAFYRKDESMVSDYPLVDYMTCGRTQSRKVSLWQAWTASMLQLAFTIFLQEKPNF
jgi:dipeptidyl-peptidase 4